MLRLDLGASSQKFPQDLSHNLTRTVQAVGLGCPMWFQNVHLSSCLKAVSCLEIVVTGYKSILLEAGSATEQT